MSTRLFPRRPPCERRRPVMRYEEFATCMAETPRAAFAAARLASKPKLICRYRCYVATTSPRATSA